MTTHSASMDPSRFLLLGDCFSAAIGQAAKAARFPFTGGPLAPALEFYREFCQANQGDIIFREPVTLKYSAHRSSANDLYRKFLVELGITRLSELRIPLVATFGFSVYLLADRENWHFYRMPDGEFPVGFLDSRLFANIVLAMSRGAMDFYRYALEMGVRVVAVMPPQRLLDSSDAGVFTRAQNIIAAEIRELGGEIIDLRFRTTDDRGLQRPELCDQKSPIHGNLAFGRLILAELLDRGLLFQSQEVNAWVAKYPYRLNCRSVMGDPGAIRVRGYPEDVHRRVPISMTNSTYRRLRKIMSTVKKSHASRPRPGCAGTCTRRCPGRAGQAGMSCSPFSGQGAIDQANQHDHPSSQVTRIA